MNTSDAVELIRGGVSGHGGVWADFGAGDGTFTRALAELLGPGGRIHAIDKDARAISAIERWTGQVEARVVPVVADFSRPLDVPGLGTGTLDGLLFANALHFVREAGQVLARLGTWLKPFGRVGIVEYDRRAASRWVPYPIPLAQLPALAAGADLSPPIITGERPSAYGGKLYAAVAQRQPAWWTSGARSS